MSEIRITRKHTLALEDARKVAQGVAGKLKKEFGLECTWKSNVLHFERPGVNGVLHVTDHDVRLEAKLGLLLGFMKPRIESEIEAQFDEYFRPKSAKKPASKKPAPAGKPQKAAHRRPSSR